MTRLQPHQTDIEPQRYGSLVNIHPASRQAAYTVIDASPDDNDGRSDWMWVRLPNGDLILGLFPQGGTYEAVEGDAAYPGPQQDILWCEQCGENTQAVHTKDTGLCGACAAALIDELISKEA